MMYQVTPDEAKRHLEELIEAAIRGEQVVIAHDDQHAVQLVPLVAPTHRNRTAGTARGKIALADDFDEPLPDFADYMRYTRKINLRMPTPPARRVGCAQLAG